MEIKEVQQELRERGIDGWLFYDFQERDKSAYKILRLSKSKIFTRRWAYMIPAMGTPLKLCHMMEASNLDHLPGKKLLYLPWQEYNEHLASMVKGKKTVAMLYSPDNSIPYLSVVDIGTADFIRKQGVNIVSSGYFVTKFESYLNSEGINSHLEALQVVNEAKDLAFQRIAARIRNGDYPREYEIQQFMIGYLIEKKMTFDIGPIVSVNEHSADPHFIPNPENSTFIKDGDLVLIDVWAKNKRENSIYADITWMGYVGDKVPSKHEKIFQICCKARDDTFSFIRKKFVKKQEVRGCDADDVARNVVKDAGYGEYFIHRTGHNIGTEVHGPGVHLDNLESMDERELIKGSCFSIEPGIYITKAKAGYRTEINVYITDEGSVNSGLERQNSIIPIMR